MSDVGILVRYGRKLHASSDSSPLAVSEIAVDGGATANLKSIPRPTIDWLFLNPPTCLLSLSQGNPQAIGIMHDGDLALFSLLLR